MASTMGWIFSLFDVVLSRDVPTAVRTMHPHNSPQDVHFILYYYLVLLLLALYSDQH